jgi:hypothetical protein
MLARALIINFSTQMWLPVPLARVKEEILHLMLLWIAVHPLA